jgi:transposase-like protein
VTAADRGRLLQLSAEPSTPARHVTERYANNRVEADHGGVKARLRPTRGLRLKHLATAAVIAAGHDPV